MYKFLSKIIDKLYVKQWQIGYCRGDIKEIIRSKTFNPDIHWLPLNSLDFFRADPFLLRTKEGKLSMLFENFVFDDFYGKIWVMNLDENFKQLNEKILLDTKSHLSYPFTYEEDGKIYFFPESAHSGKLNCYEYDPVNQSLMFIKEIMDLPLLDSTIIKYKNKYWLFGTLNGKFRHMKLYIYYSDSLLGPYKSHPQNPVKCSLNGARPAGNFIEVDGVLYRPSQNCENQYGESMTVNRVEVLNELEFHEETHMTITINKDNPHNDKVLTIHTLNVLDDLMVVDGIKWTFSPKNQWKNFLRNRASAEHTDES